VYDKNLEAKARRRFYGFRAGRRREQYTVELFYEDHGSGSPVVLIHGGR
jgi:hypothetical protein